MILEDLLPRTMAALFRIESDPLRDRPLGQIRLMRYLSAGDRTCSELKETLGMSASSVTQVSNRLIAAGLIEKVTVEGDGRLRRLRLSPLGRSLMRERRRARAASAEGAIGELSERQIDELISALRALTGVVEPGAIEPESVTR